jgi:hypothetical protein
LIGDVKSDRFGGRLKRVGERWRIDNLLFRRGITTESLNVVHAE